MTVRALDSNGDIVTSGVMFLTGKEEVAQTLKTNLKMFLGEYFRDITKGTPWYQSILGKNNSDNSLADKNAIIKNIILQTSNVVKLLKYDSEYDITTRKYSLECSVLSTFGEITISIDNNFGVI